MELTDNIEIIARLGSYIYVIDHGFHGGQITSEITTFQFIFNKEILN